MKEFIDTLKKTFASRNVSKRFKECKHGFEISDVLDIKKDPECNKCSTLLSNLSNA